MKIMKMMRGVTASMFGVFSGVALCQGAGLVPVQTFKITADDAVMYDYFGFSVAVSGTTAVIGARIEGLYGSAYVFDSASGEQLFKLNAEDGPLGGTFGWSVALDGTTAVVGAHGALVGGFGTNGTGAAYVFDTTTGLQLFRLIADDGATNDWLGRSVSISGTIAAAGAMQDDDAGSNSGSAYLFDTTTGDQLFKLTADDGEPLDHFGSSVAVSGTHVLIGAYADDRSGSAYLFNATTGKQLYKFIIDNAEFGDNIGRSVALSGTTAVIGAPYDDDNEFASGSVYVYDIVSGQMLFQLHADDPTVYGLFGWSVAISGTTIVVGAQFDDGGAQPGAVYVFDSISGELLYKLVADDAAFGDEFGYTVAVNGTTAIVGAYKSDDNGSGSGSAYIFDTANCFENPLPADINGDGIVNSADLGILLNSFGTSLP